MRFRAVSACRGTGAAVVREGRILEREPGEVFVDVEDDAVVLRPVVLVVDDALGRGLGVPVLEGLEALRHRVAGRGRQLVAVGVPEVDQVEDVEVGGVVEGVDRLERRSEGLGSDGGRVEVELRVTRRPLEVREDTERRAGRE